jgi:hypothetical protein
MTNKELIIQMVHENKGTITAEQVSAYGLSRGSLKYLADKGILERTSRGVYICPKSGRMKFSICKLDLKKEFFQKRLHCFFMGLQIEHRINTI